MIDRLLRARLDRGDVERAEHLAVRQPDHRTLALLRLRLRLCRSERAPVAEPRDNLADRTVELLARERGEDDDVVAGAR